MSDETRTGSVLVKEGTALPAGLRANPEPFVPGWSLVENADVVDTQRALDEANWHFFYAEPEIETSAYSRDLNRAIKKAVQRLTRKVEGKKLNAVQISFLFVTKVFGFYHVTVLGFARHVQQSAVPPQSQLKEKRAANQRSGGDAHAA